MRLRRQMPTVAHACAFWAQEFWCKTWTKLDNGMYTHGKIVSGQSFHWIEIDSSTARCRLGRWFQVVCWMFQSVQLVTHTSVATAGSDRLQKDLDKWEATGARLARLIVVAG